MTRYSDETIYEHFLLIAEEIQPFSIRRASKAIKDKYNILVGEDKLRRIIQTFGRKQPKPEQFEPSDFSFPEEWAERFAREFRLNPKKVLDIVNDALLWAIKTKPPKKLFPW